MRLTEDTIYVVECSSYQIDLAPRLHPDIGILLNLAPDHLERHGTMDHYAEVKSRLVWQSTQAIIGVDDPHCLAFLRTEGRKPKNVVSLSNGSNRQADLVYKDGRFCKA